MFSFNLSAFEVIVLILATWRMSNLVANEDGPHLIFRKLRRQFEKWDRKFRWFRRAHWVVGIQCEYCNSIWFGILLMVGRLVFGDVFLWVTLPLALSAGAIVIKHVVFLLKGADVRLHQINNPQIKRSEDE